MIYTSYFANLNKLPKDITPISICAKAPEWYKGLKYKKLAPTYNILMKYKQDYDKNYYIEHYQKEVLDKLNPADILHDLYRIVNPKNYTKLPHIALICFEKPEDFCHRYLVANWLIDNGYKVEEYKGE